MITIKYQSRNSEEIKTIHWTFDPTDKIPCLEHTYIISVKLTGIEFHAANAEFSFTDNHDFSSEYHLDNSDTVWPGCIKQRTSTRLEFINDAARHLLGDLARWSRDMYVENSIRNTPDYRSYWEVGIFWGLGNRWLISTAGLKDAETYGNRLGHGEHAAFWNKCAAEKFNDEVQTSEYDRWPCGRVVYDKPAERFFIYADRKLLYKYDVWQITCLFHIPIDRNCSPYPGAGFPNPSYSSVLPVR